MHSIQGTYTPCSAVTAYADAVNLCITALSRPADKREEWHQKVLALVPQGAYLHYKGDTHYALKVVRGFTVHGHDRYFVLTIPYGFGLRSTPTRRLLVGMESGEKDGWFLPVTSGLQQKPRFTLLEALDRPSYAVRRKLLQSKPA